MLRKAAYYYLSWLVLIWPAIALYRNNIYYKGFLTPTTQRTLLALALAYTVLAPIAYFITYKRGKTIAPSRGYEAVVAFGRFLSFGKKYFSNYLKETNYQFPALSRQDRTSLLFMLVKLFFLPIMVSFLFTNIDGIKTGLNSINSYGFGLSQQTFNQVIYPFFISVLLLIDTAYFSFAYTFEIKWLNNKVISVDPTFLGWASALICYPPFNDIGNRYVYWWANDSNSFRNLVLTTILHLLVLGFFVIYVAATVALGAKATNLTNRGIVSRWPYNMIRHPAYASKNIAWWLTIIPVFSFGAVIGMAAWSSVYLIRSLTEERHLMMIDNGYREYARKVKYRFIPKVI